MSLEEALQLKPGIKVRALFTCIAPYTLIKGKDYTVLDINPLYRSPGVLGNVLFKIWDDTGIEVDVPVINFSW